MSRAHLLPVDSRQTYSRSIGEATNYMQWVVDEMRPFFGKNILEVGLGHGAYRQFLGTPSRYWGVDIDQKAVAAARRQHSRDRFEQADITRPDFVRRFRSRRIDTILAINVLEHIPKDTRAFENLVDLLVPGGHLLLWLPAMPLLFNDLDRLAGHERRYTKESLALHLRGKADLLQLRYTNPLGGLGWWANTLVRKKSLNDLHVNVQIRLFDRFVLPLSRLLSGFCGNFFGQSVFAVAKKRKDLPPL